MKKLIALLMVSVMVLSLVSLVGCQTTPATLKLGLGVSVSASGADATADVNGADKLTVTAAAVLVDKDGKIVKAVIDCADSSVAHTADGKAVATESFKSKLELGDDYGMKAPYGSEKEWYEHVEIFCNLIVGKTAAEVKALVAENNKGSEEVLNAGCTILVSDFAIAVEKAINNAVDTTATANDTLKLGVATSQTATDATEDTAGSNKLETYLFAAAVNADGKVVAGKSDCVEATITFALDGKTTYDATKAVKSKLELGDDYGMKSPYGSQKEWYEHAAAFDAACAGKSATEIKALMGNDGKGTADLQSAGCTIYVSGFVKAAAKIG